MRNYKLRMKNEKRKEGQEQGRKMSVGRRMGNGVVRYLPFLIPHFSFFILFRGLVFCRFGRNFGRSLGLLPEIPFFAVCLRLTRCRRFAVRSLFCRLSFFSLFAL